ncbi:MAG: phosphate ABC transporter ATP-binding protein PstB [Candidatus Palauibacterales bacterium]|nr:phosphate ABC transporter ATP-binding protein PstB [Candidatus Palauibacterales bacterium]
MAEALPRLEARQLTARFGPTPAVRDVTLTFRANTVTAIIGPSGCGKSTFLRCLNRLHELSRQASVDGQVLLDGDDIYAPDVNPVGVRRRIGMVFQQANPFPTLSIFDNVAAGLRINGRRSRRDVAEPVERALRGAALWDEVKDRLDANPLGLSGGQQQRLCIARAIAPTPDVLLLDEPTSALDPIATQSIEELVQELKRDFTVVIVTHNMQQAARVSDSTAFFYLGELVEHDVTTRMFTAPSEARTEAYVTGRFG